MKIMMGMCIYNLHCHGGVRRERVGVARRILHAEREGVKAGGRLLFILMLLIYSSQNKK
jgi:hypothetical protein